MIEQVESSPIIVKVVNQAGWFILMNLGLKPGFEAEVTDLEIDGEQSAGVTLKTPGAVLESIDLAIVNIDETVTKIRIM